MLLVEGKEKKKKPPRAHIVYSECSPSSLLHRPLDRHQGRTTDGARKGAEVTNSGGRVSAKSREAAGQMHS